METSIVNPSDGIYPATDDYVHALAVERPARFLFVAGTIGLDHAGLPAPNLDGQLQAIWSNIEKILETADMTMDNIVRVTSYLSDRAYADANAEARVRVLGDRRVPTTAIVAELLSPDWLVEIEVVAAA